MATKELVVQQPETQALTSPARLIEMALAKGADPEKLGMLMELQFKWEANEAKKAYIAALKRFKANPPEIKKTKLVKYKNKDNTETKYYHSELDVINDIIQPRLQEEGLYATWRSSDNNGRITMTCVLTHEMGYSEDISTLSGPADTSGGKNNIQGIGSTTTYLKRYTLETGLGLVSESDDDGKSSAGGLPPKAIEEFLMNFRDAMNHADLQKAYVEAYEAAKAASDNDARRKFIEARDQRRTEIKA